MSAFSHLCISVFSGHPCMLISDYGFAHLHLHASHMQATGVDAGLSLPRPALGNAASAMVYDLGTSVTQDAHSLWAKEWAPILSLRLSPQNLNPDRIIKRLKCILCLCPEVRSLSPTVGS